MLAKRGNGERGKSGGRERRNQVSEEGIRTVAQLKTWNVLSPEGTDSPKSPAELVIDVGSLSYVSVVCLFSLLVCGSSTYGMFEAGQLRSAASP